MQISITVTGTSEIVAKLNILKLDLSNFGPELESTGEFLKSYYYYFPFTSEGQIWGKPWAPLNPAYAVEKSNKYRGTTILVASGNMRKSFEFTSTSDYCRIFNNTEYFKYHQLGTSRMPQRLVMSLNTATNSAIAGIFKAGIDAKIKALSIT